MLGDTNGDFKRKLLGKTEEKVRGYRSVALSHYCGNGYAFCVMISRKLGLADRPPQGQIGRVPSVIAIGTWSSLERARGMHTVPGPDGVSEARFPDHRRVTWRPPAGRTAGSGDHCREHLPQT